MLFKTQSSALYGIDAYIVQVEVDLAQGGDGKLITVGLPDAAVKESRERIRAAIKNCGFVYPPFQNITVNLAPADLPRINEVRIDVAVVLFALGLSLVSTVIFGLVLWAADRRPTVKHKAHGLTLKDASAFNIQFIRGRPMLIDTASFARCRDGDPWIGYRQFCQHFLAPLTVMATRDVRLGWLTSQLDGLPLDLASRLLPRSTWFRFGCLLHVHLHARSIRRFAHTSLRA